MNYQLYHGDCLEVMPTLPDASIDLIVTDPPYFRVKNEPWDRQWNDAAAFIGWIGQLCEQWQRILKPNGSLYVFASPKMAARVEVKIGEWFNVLDNITWVKPDPSCKINYGAGRGGQCNKDILRSWFPRTEEIIFAEHPGADGYAKGEAGYTAKCDQLRGFVFEPLRAYLDGERVRAGIPHRLVIKELGMMGHDTHFFSPIQWKLPLKEQYKRMREIFSRNNHGGEYLRREYEDLRREYEDLRREYEDLRRPFNISADVPYTDVWNFPTVSHYPGKHPCEKPLAMMEHIITASSKPGAVVLDCFAGSGVTGEAAVKHGRRFIGIEKHKPYFDQARRRMDERASELRGEYVQPRATEPIDTLPLFQEAGQ